jgi:hypothetical protein
MLELPGHARRSASLIPVAKPAGIRGQVQTEGEEPARESTGLAPSTVKSWASSLGLHLLLILIFALWVFTPSSQERKPFDTRLELGEAGGSPGDGDGGALVGLDGLDEPFTVSPPPPNPVQGNLLRLTTDELAVDIDDATKSTAKAANRSRGPNVELANPGAGGGGAGEGFGLAKFGNGTENVGGVGVKVGDPQFTLIWDSQADIDLHVVEPGGSEIYWEHPHANQGGELDVDDIDGFGPENVYWVQGQGPPGDYRWYVHYYGGLGGRSVPTGWKVRIKHNGQVTVVTGKLNSVGARSKLHTLAVEGK